MRGRGLPCVLLALQLAVFWPSWSWYVVRMQDGADEPWGLIALFLALCYILIRGRHQPSKRGGLAIAAMLSVFYCLMSGQIPALLSAAIAMCALCAAASALLFGQVFCLRLFGLLLLSLPIISSLQFFAGFPVRLLTTQCTAFLLGCLGYSAKAQGTLLHFQGELLAVDAPCAGIKMLWSSLLVHFGVAAFSGLSQRMTWLGYCATSLLVFLANVLRTFILFFSESGIVATPSWFHQSLGLVIFFLVVLLILKGNTLLRALSKPQALADTRVYTESTLATREVSFAVLCLFAVCYLVICYQVPGLSTHTRQTFAGGGAGIEWPSEFEGQALHRQDLSEREAKYFRDFPGAVARFSDGQRHLLVRYVHSATRKLHPAADCLRGAGYEVSPLPLREEPGGALWNCSRAKLPAQAQPQGQEAKILRVCEQIVAQDGTTLPDVSTWFWAAFLGRSQGPWFAYTLSEPFEA